MAEIALDASKFNKGQGQPITDICFHYFIRYFRFFHLKKEKKEEKKKSRIFCLLSRKVDDGVKIQKKSAKTRRVGSYG